MNPYHQSLTLIGMPGAGKSTLGLLLAKSLAKDFVDTDLLIQLEHRKTLQDILLEQGYLGLREAEGSCLKRSIPIISLPPAVARFTARRACNI